MPTLIQNGEGDVLQGLRDYAPCHFSSLLLPPCPPSLLKDPTFQEYLLAISIDSPLYVDISSFLLRLANERNAPTGYCINAVHWLDRWSFTETGYISLILCLRLSNRGARLAAAERILRGNPSSGHPLFMNRVPLCLSLTIQHALCDEQDDEVVCAALHIIIKHGYVAISAAPKFNMLAMVAVTVDSHQKTVEMASKALNCCGDYGIQTLLAFLSDHDPIMREAGARGIALLTSPPVEAIDHLIVLLSDAHHAVSTNAASALAAIGKPAVEPILRAIEQDDNYKVYGLQFVIALGPSAHELVPSVIACLRSKHPRVRDKALEAMRSIGLSVVPQLIDAFKFAVARNEPEIIDVTVEALKAILPESSERIIASIKREAFPANTSFIRAIEIMGEKAPPHDAMVYFFMIGKICKQNNTDTFSFTKMAQLLDVDKGTLANYLSHVSSFFKWYFETHEHIQFIIASDKDETADPALKIFDRGMARKPKICPLGWRAWGLIENWNETK